MPLIIRHNQSILELDSVDQAVVAVVEL